MNPPDPESDIKQMLEASLAFEAFKKEMLAKRPVSPKTCIRALGPDDWFDHWGELRKDRDYDERE